MSAGSVTYWVLGVVAALLLFASVVVHELGHSLVARSRGLRVDNITLFIFGGVSNIAREPATARDEFLISVVGPLTSLVLAGLFWSIGVLLPPESAASAVAGYLAYANLLLGLFNIVPGFPLDGGRVLRSIVWGVTGDMLRATQVASYVGQAVAFVLIGWGVLQALSGDVFGGIWIGFIGWFLNSGAEASRQHATAESALAKVPVTSLMDASPEHLSPELTVSNFVLEHAMRRGQQRDASGRGWPTGRDHESHRRQASQPGSVAHDEDQRRHDAYAARDTQSGCHPGRGPSTDGGERTPPVADRPEWGPGGRGYPL